MANTEEVAWVETRRSELPDEQYPGGISRQRLRSWSEGNGSEAERIRAGLMVWGRVP